MPEPFHGVVNLDIRDSTPDWAPFSQPVAPPGTPNVVYVVLDDVGFGALGCYGGLIDTPNIDRIAAAGLRYTQWHTTALCSPTRSCLLTGRNHTTNGMACITEAATGFPNGNGHVPPECATLAEVLVERGISTAMVGKWHLCAQDEMNLAASKRNWPVGRGFERFYGFLGAETNQWYPDLVHDNHPVDAPATPAEGYHLSVDLTDKAIEFIDDVKTIAPERPVFLYYALGAAHAPHHVPQEWADRYKGRFDMGYEAAREQILARQKELGIVPATPSCRRSTRSARRRTGPGRRARHSRRWTTPSRGTASRADERRLFARMAEVYAGFLSHADDQIGRLLDYLESIDQLENTLIFVVSDNGASGEGGPNGSVNENKFFNGIPDDLAAEPRHARRARRPGDVQPLPDRLGDGLQHPVQDVEALLVQRGHRDPCIVSWPAGIAARGEIRHQYHHAIDLVPTVLECLGIAEPDEVRGVTQIPIQGVSMVVQLRRRRRAVGAEDAVLLDAGHPRDLARRVEGGHHPPGARRLGELRQDTWELYHVETDRSELHDLAAEEPERLAELIGLWFYEAGANHAFPLDDRSALEIILTPRPQLIPARDRYVYRPGRAEIPEHIAVNVRNR